MHKLPREHFKPFEGSDTAGLASFSGNIHNTVLEATSNSQMLPMWRLKGKKVLRRGFWGHELNVCCKESASRSAPITVVLTVLGRVALTMAFTALFFGCSPSPQEPEELLVFAAASLADVLGEIQGEFEEREGVRVVVSYGGSQMLAQQIASGGPADVFISAGSFPVEFLAERGLLETRSELLTTSLVVAVRAGDGPQIDAIDQLNTTLVRRIAVANPRLAPAGHYARESLTRLGLWDAVEPKLVFGPDVRATLAYVESGNADVALVYATDARASRSVRVLDIVPPDSYQPVTYEAAVVAGTARQATAMSFVSHLHSPNAGEFFRRYGFEPTQ